MSTLFQTNETLQANRQQKMLDILKVSTLNKNGETADNKKSIYSVLPADSKLVRSEVNDTNFSINTDLQTSIRSSLNANSEVDATTTFLNEAYAAQKAGKVVDQNYLSALEKNILTATGGEQYYSKETGKLENTPDISGMDFAQKNALSNEQKSAIANYEYIREGSFNQRIKAEALNHSVEEYMTAEQLEMYNGALSQVGTGTIDQDGLDRIKTDFYVDSLKENGQFDAFKESFNTSFNETGKESLKTQMHIALNDSYSESGWLANTSNEAVGIPTMDTFVVLDSQMNTAGIGIDSTQWMGYGTIGSAALGYDYSIVKKYGELLSNGQSLIEVSTTDQRTAMFGTSFPDVLINEAWQGALRNDTSNWNTIARILDGWVDNLTLAPESGEVPTIHINSDVNSKFTQANVQAFGDPLVMDLDGDGIETVASDGSVLFDHNADGVKTGTGWAASDDGLLVRDLDGSGTIDNGQELFGDNTIKADGTKAIDGFDALSDLDSNADGIFNSQDTAFEEVKVWQDKNQDGISQADELMSLSEAGIADINLNTNTVNQNVAGGVLRKEATVTNVDGTTTKVGAMDFAENKFHSEFTDNLEIPEELQGSVNVAGQGALRSLNEAASQSPELKELLTNLYSGEVAITDAAINEVLLEWAKTSSNNNNFTTSLELLDGITLDDGTQINVGVSDRVRTIIEKTAVLEAINGERLLDYQINDHGSYYNIYVETGSEISNFSSGNATVSKGGTVALNDWDYHRLVDNGRTTLINDAYASAFNSIKEAINTSLIAKEIQPMLLENISFELDANGEVALNFDGINEMLVNNIKADPAGGINFLSKVIEAKDVTLLNNGWDSQAFLEGNVANVLSEIIGSEVSFAVTNNGNFTINGKSFDLNSLAGTSGADFILGTSDNDIINAGTGDDEIYGKLGDDVINTGDGNDTVYAGEGNDRVTVGINNGYNSIYGESGDDVLNATGSWSRNTLDGGEGNDTIRGGYQNDVLRGGSGDDVISTGERSSDYVEGGLGNDTLISDYGSKDVVYKYNLGDGFDTIKRGSTKFYSSWGNIHQDYFKQKVVFGEGISSSDVSFSKEGNDLLLQIGADATQGMRVEGFYSGDGKYKSKVSRFEFADGTVLSESNISTVVTGSTNEADVLSGGSSHDYIESLSGDDVINTGDGNDTVYAGEGNDRVTVGINNGYNSIYGESGDDVLNATGSWSRNTLDGGEGNDTIRGGYQNDVLRGGSGDDVISTGERSSDYVEGGLGNDTLISDYGSKDVVYKYNLGDGFDTIKRGSTKFYSSWGNIHQDYFKQKVVFGEGISSSDVSFSKEGNDLLLQIGADATQGMRVEGFYSGDGKYKSKVSRFEFADGTVLSESNISLINFIGSSSNDTLVGNSNDNVISGNEGNDIIAGGVGDDVISGGEGSDTYRYSQGDGNDILDVSSNDGTMDTLELTDIDHASVNLSRAGEDLLIKFASDPLGSVIVDDYFSSQYTNQGLEIDANDGFALDLSANSNKIAELLAASGADDIDIDGGSVDGTVQTTTKLSSSELADLWLPKQSNEF